MQQETALAAPLHSSIAEQDQQATEALDESQPLPIPSALAADDSCALVATTIGCMVSCDENLCWRAGGCGFTADFCGYDWRGDDEFEECIHFWCKDLVRAKAINTSLNP